MAKTRTFIAIEALDAVHACALHAIDALRSVGSDVKWVSPDNLHWTLQFLGDISDHEIAQVCRAVGRVARRHEPFLLVARGVGAFPKPERPRTLWLGADAGSAALCALQRDIEAELSELEFRGERRQFVPHLTLGRIGRGRRDAAALAEPLYELADFDAGVMTVDQVHVLASVLHREGPEYQVLSRAVLADGG